MLISFRSLKGGEGTQKNPTLTFSLLVKQSKASGVLVVVTHLTKNRVYNPTLVM